MKAVSGSFQTPLRSKKKVGTLGSEGAAPGSGRTTTSSRFHHVGACWADSAMQALGWSAWERNSWWRILCAPSRI
jgi:hypothetical protein